MNIPNVHHQIYCRNIIFNDKLFLWESNMVAIPDSLIISQLYFL